MKSKTHMLATDLDGTLVGDREALKELLIYYEGMADETALVYVTGRHLASVVSLMEAEGLPQPDILITDVGTAIYRTDQLQEDREWSRQMEADWEPQRIIEEASHFPALLRQDLPDHRRISFTIPPDDVSVKDFEKVLNEKGVSHQMIISSNRDVDILPEKSGKGSALTYVLEKYASENVHVLIAGDSGNDIDMLTLGHPAVIVGNAQPELMDMAPHANLYRAKGKCAGGILEAWQHFYA